MIHLSIEQEVCVLHRTVEAHPVYFSGCKYSDGIDVSPSFHDDLSAQDLDLAVCRWIVR